jgi:oligopeptide transport system substrate-binding protein
MNFDPRTWFGYGCVLLLLAAVVWAMQSPDLEPADFTFVNNTELKSIDPAVVTGQPEGRVLQGLFEGLTSLNAKTLMPTPGIAERWEISDDLLTYTFHLRQNARWSDGTTITAQDVQWSLRRFLDPLTAAQYAYQAWYIKNARRYTTVGLEPGDPVEVELNERPPGSLPFARGRLLHGKLIRIDKVPDGDSAAARKLFVVEIDGQDHSFLPGGGEGFEDCRQVLLDFHEVGVRVVDRATLEIELDSPTPYFLSLLAFYPLFPVQPECIETFGSPEWTKPEHIVTSGPFHLHSRRLRDRLRMTRSKTYWDRERVQCQTIDALAVESATTGFNLYLTGDADWVATIPPPIVPTMLAGGRDDFHPVPELSVYFYRINCTRPPLDDKRIRRALAMAMNKRQIVETVTRAGEVPARHFVPPGMPGYTSPPGPAYDPEAARKLLAEAGFPGGEGCPKIPILYNTDEGHQSIAELIQDQWKRTLGIDVAPENQPWPAYLSAQRELKYAVARAGWSGDYLDPNTFLDLFVTDGENNETGWSNAEYDALIRDAATETDPAKRMKMFERAEAILLDEMPIVPIYFRVSKNVVRPYVNGFYNNPLDMHPLKASEVDAAAKRRMFDSIEAREASEASSPEAHSNQPARS